MRIVKKYNIPKELIANIELEAHEKTEDDIEIEKYYGIYQAKQKAKEEREERLEEIRKTQFTNNLSDEMERKLRQIAKEKGLHYEEEPDGDDLFDEYQKFRTTFTETEELIKSAREYLNENTRNEFDTQNEKVDDDSFVQEDKSNSADAETFNLFDDDTFAKKEEQQEQVQEAEPVKPVELNEDDKVLNILQKKNTTVVSKTEAPKTKSKSHLIHSGIDVVKNNESKVAAKVDPAKNGRSLESFMQSLKEEPKAEEKKETPKVQKPVATKGRGGVFIGNIDDENN
jgi:hypothetical protein